MSTRQNQWFVPGDGIAREVITADIQRYLGPDALVRPGTGTGEYEGRPGYWITAYRTLTSQMIQDLKADSQRWQTERDGGRGRGVDYRDSRTHAARQEWGPSESYSQSRDSHSRTPHTAAYPDSGHYTTSPTTAYGSHPAGYPVAQPAYAAQPRTDPYAGYPQVPGQHPSYPAAQTYPTYTQTPAPDPYRAPAPPQNYTTTAPRPPVAQPGYYIASDGRQYPLSQRPTNGSSR